MRPWDYEIPRFLYKYYPPERFNVLAEMRVCFSRRTAFDDNRELRPDVEKFGTEEEIRAFLAAQPDVPHEGAVLDVAIQHIINDEDEQRRVAQLAQERMRSPDEYGVFCLSEIGDDERMWRDYAANRTGFVLKFDTTSAAFDLLRSRSLFGRVAYSDERMGTFLGTLAGEGAGIFYRKRLRYAFEREWRGICRLAKLERTERKGIELFFAHFDPKCLASVTITTRCAIECELRHFIAIDSGYSHLGVSCVR